MVDKSDGSPAWGDAGVVLTWHMYRMYGDNQIIQDNYHAMEKWLGYIGSSNPTFIWKNKLNHNYGDWLNVNATTPKEIVSTAYYAYDAHLMSKMAKAIGKTTDADKYQQLHKNIAKAFNREFVNETTGKIRGDTQCDYVLALAFKLLPSELLSKAVKHLVDNIQAHNWHLSTGFIGKFHHLLVYSIIRDLHKFIIILYCSSKRLNFPLFRGSDVVELNQSSAYSLVSLLLSIKSFL